MLSESIAKFDHRCLVQIKIMFDMGHTCTKQKKAQMPSLLMEEYMHACAENSKMICF